MRRLCVCSMKALKAQRPLHAVVGNRQLMVLQVGDQVVAYDAACLHQGGPLDEGSLVGSTLTCPWHGCRWDMRTGQMIGVPRLCLKSYAATLEKDGVYVTMEENV